MKFLLVLLFLPLAVFATPPKSGGDLSQDQVQLQAQLQAQAQIAKGGNASAKAYAGDANVVDSGNSAATANNSFSAADAINARINNSITHNERLQHVATRLGNNCVGSACQSTNAFSASAGYDDIGKGSVLFGIVVPWGGGGKVVDRAMKYEAQKLADRNLHDREKHQTDMMIMCMELHRIGVIHEGASPELWNRCAGFEHHNPKTSGPLKSHNGYGDPRQVAPH